MTSIIFNEKQKKGEKRLVGTAPPVSFRKGKGEGRLKKEEKGGREGKGGGSNPKVGTRGEEKQKPNSRHKKRRKTRAKAQARADRKK